jgi:hypothetical protein
MSATTTNTKTLPQLPLAVVLEKLLERRRTDGGGLGLVS